MTLVHTRVFSGNRWLDRLPEEVFGLLEPHLKKVALKKGEVLFQPGQDVRDAVFPVDGAISLVTVLRGGRTLETATVGPEGVVGLTCGPMNGRAVSRAVAHTSARGWRLDTERMDEALAQSAPLRRALARHTEALFAQVQQNAACNAHHRIDARMAKQLLMLHDRNDGNAFDLTHAVMAEMMGVRRATVTDVGAELEKRGLIRRTRGRVEVTDREGLERTACECYQILRKTLTELGEPPPMPS